jgi:hypothetical protein
MLKKNLIWMTLAVLILFGAGCKKSDDGAVEPESSLTQFKQAAEKEITSENAETELDKLEQEIEKESAEQ